MKLQILRLSIIFVIFASILFAGCTSKPVPYSFTDDIANSCFVIIQPGNPGLTLLSYEGISLPRPAGGTHWSPVSFPSNRPLRLVLFAKYEVGARTRVGGLGLLGDMVNIAGAISEVARNVETQVTFNGPRLEAGKTYILAFLKDSGIPGKNRLILTEVESRSIIHEQEFDVTLGGFNTR